jgi:hypothetical protein
MTITTARRRRALTIVLDVLWGLIGFVVSLAAGIAYLRCC